MQMATLRLILRQRVMMILVFASTAQRLQQLAFAILGGFAICVVLNWLIAHALNLLSNCSGVALLGYNATVTTLNASQNAAASNTTSTARLISRWLA
jgi:hypothetical protein